MITGLLFSLVAAQANASLVADFRAAYQARSGDLPSERPDPAISKDLDILLKVVSDGLARNPKASEEVVYGWLSPFRKVVMEKDGREDPVDEYHAITVGVSRGRNVRLVVVRMGAVTRTIATDRQGKRISLPRRYAWNTPWYPEPKVLPSGLVLMNQSSIQAAGSRVRLRLDWLRIQNGVATEVGHFQGPTILENETATVNGNLVTAHTIDEPLTLSVSSAQAVFERITTWTVKNNRPVLQAVKLAHPTLRAIDSAVFKAWHAKHPTALEAKIRHLWPMLEGAARVELSSWKETRRGNGVRVNLNGDVVFELTLSQKGFRVRDIHK